MARTLVLRVLYWKNFALRRGFQRNKEGDSRKYRIETVSSIEGSVIVYNTTILSWKAWSGEPALAYKPLLLICLQTWTKRKILFEGSGFFFFISKLPI
jgi:hypothetical protein